MINSFKVDFWTFWGLFAQGLFFLRFIIQWYSSEKAGKVVVPKIFWFISLLGAVMVIVYAAVRSDLVFLVTGTLQIFLYSRNIKLIFTKVEKREKKRD